MQQIVLSLQPGRKDGPELQSSAGRHSPPFDSQSFRVLLTEPNWPVIISTERIMTINARAAQTICDIIRAFFDFIILLS